MFSGSRTLHLFITLLSITRLVSLEVKTSRNGIRLKRQTSNTSPSFPKDEYRASIPENQAAGLSVILLTATDPDQGENGKLTYSMTALRDSRSNDMFTINPISGQVTTTKKLDREEIPRHDFAVTATDNNALFKKSAVAMLIITVQDENDHTPTFDLSVYKVETYEDSPVSTSIATVRAIDRDSGKNREIRYSIIVPANPSSFEIDPISGSISTLKVLDREAQASYQLIVQAKDQASFGKQRSSTATIEIKVLDENDNMPEFAQSSYTVNVPEEIPVSSQIARVLATDKDDGLNGEIVYSLVSGNIGDTFWINSTSGQVFSRLRLDHELINQINLTIEASDKGQLHRTTITTLKINILDINDNAPFFQQDNYTAMVREDALIGTLVVTVNAFDSDSGNNSELDYSIPYAPSDFPFSIDYKDGEIHVSSQLDRELQDYYSLIVTARDHGMPPFTSTATVEIRLLDVNDNSPVFSNKQVHVDIPDDASLGQYVAHLKATDIDLGLNAVLTYNIVNGNNENMFGIGIKTGIITLERTINNTKINHFVLTVTASDGIHFDTSKVYINVTYSSQNVLSFLLKSYQFDIYENVAIGTLIGNVQVIVNGTVQNGGITYELLKTDAFTINPGTGEIRSNAQLDREIQLAYWFEVRASANADTSHQATAAVSVSLKDQNDNPPYFSKSIYEASITKPVSAGRIVTTVRAADADAGINSQIRYSLRVANSILQDFNIDSMSGAIYIARSNTIDKESTNTYTMTVLAVDGGIVRLTAQSLVKIKVEATNVIPVG